MSERFSKLRFRGSARFDGPIFPVEVLPDLVTYRELIFEATRQLYLDRNPGRRKVPRGFENRFNLSIIGIEDGSSCPVFARVLIGSSLVVGMQAAEADRYYDEGRTLVEEVVLAVDNGDELPIMSPKLVETFARFGNTLKESEQVFLRVPSDPTKSTAPFSLGHRESLLARIQAERWDEVAWVGDIINADRVSRQFTLRVGKDRRPFKLDQGFDPNRFKEIFDYTRDGALVKVSGIAHFLQGGKFKDLNVASIALADENQAALGVAAAALQLACPMALTDQIADLASLEEGWYGAGAGHRYAADFLKRVGALVEYVVTAYELPTPYLYPTEDGDVRVEWESSRWEVILRFSVDSPTISFVALEKGGDAFHETEETPTAPDDMDEIGDRLWRLLDGGDW